MSISNSALASEIGWDNAWEIPVSNEANRLMSIQLAQKTKEKDLLAGMENPYNMAYIWDKLFYSGSYSGDVIQ